MIAELCENLLSSLEQAPPRQRAARGQWTACDPGEWSLGHRTASGAGLERSSCFSTLFIAERGSALTNLISRGTL